MRHAKYYLSYNHCRQWMASQPDVSFERDIETENEIINIFPELRYQELIGIGGAFTETAAFNYASLSRENQRKAVTLLFDPQEGIGFNLGRTHINSCDFSLSDYCYIEPGDTDLRTFSVAHDEAQIIPFIQDAQKTAGGDLRLFASPWSPPAWMKDNRSICNGGRLLDAYYGVWAGYFVKYLLAYREHGVNFFAVTIQNEAKAVQPWESCVYTAEEEGVFAAQYLRPALDEAGLSDVKIMIWDHNKERVYDRARDTFRVPGAREAVWGIAYHWYSGDHYHSLEMAHDAFPEQKLVLSEFALGNSRPSTTERPHSGWNEMDFYAAEMIEDFNHYACAITDWNLLADLKEGGPFHNREGGARTAIVVDTDNDTFIVEPLYYALGHFSRFLKRGAVRLGCSSYLRDMPAVAFENPNGDIVLIVLNRTQNKRPVRIRLGEETAGIILPAESLATFVILEKNQERL